MGNFDRSVRLESVLFDEVAALLRGEVGDPDLAEAFVTRVELSSRGARARVWFSAPDANAARAAFERAQGFFRARIAETLCLKRMPELSFRWDPIARRL